jgi:hypothetical protein
MRTITSIILIFVAFNLNAQTRTLYFVSNKHTVLKANGASTNVSINKNLYFTFFIGSSDITSSYIRISSEKNWIKADFSVEYKIYKIVLEDNGQYLYWTTDVGQDGQIVLFIVDRNSSIPTITEKRYSPITNDNTVLKTIQYIIE